MDPATSATPPAAVLPQLQPQNLPAWPRSAQTATVFLLGLATALLAVHGYRGLRWGSRPTVLFHYQIDLNRADRAELLQVPGVGDGMARRIEAYRLEHGAFRSMNDLLQVQGIGPTIFERLRPWLYVQPAETDPPAISTLLKPPSSHKKADKESGGRPAASKKATTLADPINVNEATVEELQRLPSVGPKRAQLIVEARQKRPFGSIEELRRVSGIGPKTLEKLRPYITVERDPTVRLVTAGGP